MFNFRIEVTSGGEGGSCDEKEPNGSFIGFRNIVFLDPDGGYVGVQLLFFTLARWSSCILFSVCKIFSIHI